MKSQAEFYSTLWQKHYLQLEIKKLETTIKHYLDSGWIIGEDYKFIEVNLKMLRTFLNTHIYKMDKVIKDSKQIVNLEQINFRKKYSKKNIRKPGQMSLFDINNPLPITGEIKVTGLNERLDALKTRESISKGPKFPFKIPAGTHWNQVIMKFLNHEQIEILVKKLRHITNFKEMGFVGKGKIPEPSEQWIFLKVLAQCNGELTIKDDTAKDTYKQQKHLLTESLQNYFSIDFDPFYPYKSSPEKQGNSYRIKLTLIPPPESYKKPQIETTVEDTLGIKEYLDEHAPQIIEN